MTDIRVTRTNKMLCDAFEELMLEKPYEKITVSEICKRSTVRRGTFYKHFEDKEALLRFQLSTVTDSFLAAAGSAEKLAELEDLEAYASYMQRLLVSYIQNHPILSRYVLRKNAPVGVIDMMVAQIAEGIIKRVELQQLDGHCTSKLDPGFIGTFYAGGMMHMLRLWLAEEDPCSAEELVCKCTELLITSCGTSVEQR